MMDIYDLQVVIILALIPLVLAGMYYLLEAKDAAKAARFVANRHGNSAKQRRG